jgi:UDP-N-acetylglucosamine 4,6-dehydratase/5-epimerase
MYKGNRVLVIGGTGTVGQELVKQLIDYDCREIRIFSRSEVSQVEMKHKFLIPNYVIGDVRDYKALNKVMKDITYVFYLAAIKHVDICERQPEEALKTNIDGVSNLIKAALKNRTKRVIYLSTDKAINPNNFYGATKLIAEKLILHANSYYITNFVGVRSCNVFGSSGSVIPVFINQLKKFNQILLTNGEMTRFFISVQELVKMCLKVCESFEKLDIYSVSGKSFKMRDVAEVCCDLYGDITSVIKEIGLREGERMHEFLNGKSSENCIEGREEIIKMFKQWKEN